jgi:hypothetical protein
MAGATSRVLRQTTLLTGLALVAACGTTVQGASTSALPSGEGPSVTTPATPSAQLPRQGTGPHRAAAPVAGSSVPAGSQPIEGSTDAGDSLPLEPVTGPIQGVTATTIKVGYIYIADAGEVEAARGYKANNANPTTIVPTLVKYVNAHGGIAGRKLIAVAHAFKITEGTYAQQDQEACSHLTEDEHVYAVLQENSMSPTLLACLKKHGTLAITAPVMISNSSRAFTDNPLYVEATSPNLDRMAALLAEGLSAQRYFTALDARPVKVGALIADTPDFARAATVLDRHLAAHGQRISDRCLIRPSESLGDTSRVVSELSSCILRLQAASVTHVLFFIPDSGGTLFFMRQARSQGASFRYGMSSNDTPQALVGQAGIDPSQLRGAVFVGTQPLTDVAKDAKQPFGPGYNRCRSALTAAGIWDPNNRVRPSILCDYVFFFQTVLGSAPLEIGHTTFMARLERLGSAFGSATTFTTRFVPGRRYGAQQWRGGAFEDACQCFHYTTGLQEIPDP